MLAFTIAWRNVLAHGQRNIILFVVTGAVSLFLFLFLAFSDGEIENIRNGVSGFWNPPSDIKAFEKSFFDAGKRGEDQMELLLDPVDEIRKAVADHPGVTMALAHRWTQNADLFHQGTRYLGLFFFALDPMDSLQRKKYTILQGRDLSPGDALGILLHHRIQTSSDLQVGDEVTLTGKDFWGQISAQKVRILGFFKPQLDNPNIYSGAYIDPVAYASLSGLRPEEAHSLRIFVDSGKDPQKIRDELQESLGENYGIRFYLTSEISGDSGSVQVFKTIRIILVAISLLMIFITAFGIMNVVAVNLYDRKKEIGTYFCLGTEKPFLMAVYTLEILMVNLAGTLVGLASGLGVRELVNALKLSSEDPGLQVVMGGSLFYLGLSPSTVLWILGGMMSITLLTALGSLGKALRVSPVVAVREVEG